MVADVLADAVAFFVEHAGFSYDPKRETPEEGKQRCARELAAAEAWLKSVPHEVRWEEDGDADRSFLPKRDKRPLFWCHVLAKTQADTTVDEWTAESCGGIDLGPTGNEADEYMRVMVAELASELMPEAA